MDDNDSTTASLSSTEPARPFCRSARTIPNLTCLHGADGLTAALERAEILVLLLPDTPATENILDAEALGFEACFFVLIRTSAHEADWQAKFLATLRDRPEVQEAHRLAGDIDYILKVRVRNARAYDAFYQALIAEVRVQSVTALLSMEEIKSTVALPL